MVNIGIMAGITGLIFVFLWMFGVERKLKREIFYLTSRKFVSGWFDFLKWLSILSVIIYAGEKLPDPTLIIIQEMSFVFLYLIMLVSLLYWSSRITDMFIFKIIKKDELIKIPERILAIIGLALFFIYWVVCTKILIWALDYLPKLIMKL